MPDDDKNTNTNTNTNPEINIEQEKKIAAMEADLKKMIQQKDLSEKERERLNKMYESVKSNLTEEQRRLAALEEERNTLSAERDTYKQKHEATHNRLLALATDNAIIEAARKHEPISDVQLRTLLREHVTATVKDDGTIEVVGELPGMKVAEPMDKVLDHMVKDTANWGNLFKATLKSSGQAPQGDPTKQETMEEYVARRRKEEAAKK